MGLKYDIFMVKGSADEFHSKLFAAFTSHLIDTSDLSRREREYYLRPLPKPENIDESYLKSSLDPKDPELEAWMKDGGQTGFHIWWMDHPKGFVVGGFTHHWLHRGEYYAIFSGILVKAGIKEVLFQSYYHGSNEGNILKIQLGKSLDIKHYEPLADENENWEKYSRRVDKICGYPVLAWHKFISDPKIYFVPWKYTVVFKKKNEVNE